ncbi:Sas10 C-terminal domain-containing protein [Phialemonium atrogriseum]|uniref:Sas10 C-terminal domain-containing protein n=1 Tax=Phialemonium atrogriseum TaxID=1093897 RepID=A0AAJ0C1Q6_9PEZI|nr:Sas10 C-terminal domain-containing protein [Phialemonium atrogriseum]KAK1768530.1 Sas10 C-terminal domain-containing protein [Phialemonium atrogriseum]
MAKKRKAPRQAASSGPKDVDPADARLRINTFEDIADSEEEYFMNKDRIDFDEEPRSKRQRRLEDEEAFLELSDEEVLADSDESDDDEGGKGEPLKKAKSAATNRKDPEVSDEEQGGEQEDDSGWWGSSKKEYYDADQIETEADALEEEAEARRLQQKKLAKMSEADFMFDEQDWLAPTTDATEGGDVVTETLKDAKITEDMTPEDRYKLLQARYPEFDYLVDEFQTLQPLLAECQKEAVGKPSKSLEVVKVWVLGSYIASLASYFAILTSPARDSDGAPTTMDPAELRDHDIMETLMNCREMWLKVKKLQPSKGPVSDTGMLSPPEDDEMADQAEAPADKAPKDKAALKQIKALKKKAAAKAKQAQAIEDSLADLSDLLRKPKKAAKASKAGTASREPQSDADADAAADLTDDDKRSDFGEEDTIDARTAADKAQRKKSLRFYTSQIVQKANRRAGAGRDAGGDVDIPYRERLRDRQARLLADAERRGQKGSKHGVDLGDDDGDGGGSDDGGEGGEALKDQDDEYYDMVASASRKKKDEKAARQEALKAAEKGERVVEQEVVGEDGKRKITYAVLKNKGLTPRRKKEVRNPRVKKRMMYADKQKKLRSMRSTYKGGEGPGGYQGELSGIKTGLVKSVKF